jgi:hypothetical protein
MTVKAVQSPNERRTRCYLVDPASGDMLVSKTKPCMSKHSWQQ